MRWIEVGLFIEVLQLGFEMLVDNRSALRPVNVATAFFDQSVYKSLIGIVGPLRRVPTAAPSRLT